MSASLFAGPDTPEGFRETGETALIWVNENNRQATLSAQSLP
jgi:hypothetical protein